jgi:hypothetical protein
MAENDVQIETASGEVKIRRGVEEEWHPAAAGTLLENIDSILTGEGGEAILVLPDGRKFKLGSNSILDIADLRRITEEELFVILMRTKIRNLPKKEKSKLEIGQVHVVHGTSREASLEADAFEMPIWQFQKNGAVALLGNGLSTNAIVKLNSIIIRNPALEDCGEVSFYLGQAFETINKRGQAMDAYRAVVSSGCDADPAPGWLNESEQAIKRLKK